MRPDPPVPFPGFLRYLLGEMRRVPRSVATLLAVLMAAVACTSQPKPARSPDKVQFNPEPSVGTFVVVAVDNHFHDIHPVDQTRISGDRGFTIKNEGRNLHNFSVTGTAISIDIKPGGELRWPRLGDHLKPGFHTVFCKYHAYQLMTGSFWVT